MRWRRLFLGLGGSALVGAGAFWIVTAPAPLPALVIATDYKPDIAKGELLFNIGGCASCHKSVGQKDPLRLGGGLGLASPFGTFRAPNISPDAGQGIGGWSELDFVNALLVGVGRRGEHLYPAFPYTSYATLSVEDARDLFAYLKTLPPAPDISKPHELPFPFSWRRPVGGWKWLFFKREPFAPDPSQASLWNRGRFLVEGPGHCAECHSPRNSLGAIRAGARFSGGHDLETGGWVPNLTPHESGLAAWSEAEIAEFLKTGFTPDFDAAGGSMAEVIENTKRLTDADRAAMAHYLKSLPPRSARRPPRTGS